MKKCAQARLKNVIDKIYFEIIFDMYKKDLALNNLQWLICHKTNQYQKTIQRIQKELDDSMAARKSNADRSDKKRTVFVAKTQIMTDNDLC